MGEKYAFYFIDFIRDEIKFDSLEALKAQLKKDEDNCKLLIVNTNQ